MPEAVTILGVEIARLTAAEATAAIETAAATGPTMIAYANAHTLNLAHKDPTYRAILNDCTLVLNDGSGVGLAARLNGTPFPENLNGSDFNPQIAALAAKNSWFLYLLGAGPGVAEAAGERLTENIPGLVIAGARNGYFEGSESPAIAAAIKASGAAVVMVAMGNPLQEQWLAENLAATGALIGVGVGAFFDFTAGRVKRAPSWMNRFGLEWLYRLALEPGRMWRRYVLGNPAFLIRVVTERARRRRSANSSP